MLLKKGLAFWDTLLWPWWWRRIPHLLHHLCTGANDCVSPALQQSPDELSWVCATAAEDFCCWAAHADVPVPLHALWSSLERGRAGLWPSLHAGLQAPTGTLWQSFQKSGRDGTKQGHLAGSAEWINCRFPCWWTWPASHFSRCLSLGIECFLDAASPCLSGANASTMEMHISSLTNIRNCWPGEELQYVNGVPWKNRS